MCVLGMCFFVISVFCVFFFFFSSRRRHTRYIGDWSSDVYSSDLFLYATPQRLRLAGMRREVAEHWLKRLRGYEVGSFESARRKSYSHSHVMARATSVQADRSEERRVGKECRSRWSPDQ